MDWLGLKKESRATKCWKKTKSGSGMRGQTPGKEKDSTSGITHHQLTTKTTKIQAKEKVQLSTTKKEEKKEKRGRKGLEREEPRRIGKAEREGEVRMKSVKEGEIGEKDWEKDARGKRPNDKRVEGRSNRT